MFSQTVFSQTEVKVRARLRDFGIKINERITLGGKLDLELKLKENWKIRVEK